MVEALKSDIVQAQRWAQQHVATASVTDIRGEPNGGSSFVAEFRVSLPSRYARAGATRRGVRGVEPVQFCFDSQFPFSAPRIFLRDDFCRDFPHINPCKERVSPCVYAGSLAELLQQPKWFDGILDQIADWLERAAADDLMDLSQGWEPMRSDEKCGAIVLDIADAQQFFSPNEATALQYAKFKPCGNGLYFIRLLEPCQDPLPSKRLKKREISLVLIACPAPTVISKEYTPNKIRNYGDLSEFARTNGLGQACKKLDELVQHLVPLNKPCCVLILGLRRPAPLIGTTHNIEFLSFLITIRAIKKSKKLHRKSSVSLLANLSTSSPQLLSRFSGVSVSGNIKFVQLGCGSLGSKICLHLARNGNERFAMVDGDRFYPHNNARHALVGMDGHQKSSALRAALTVLGATCTDYQADLTSALGEVDANSVVIDSTASLAVRNLLVRSALSGRLVHTALYEHGGMGLLTIEGAERNPRVDDLLQWVLLQSMDDQELREKLLAEQAVIRSIGQGCSSVTTIAPDSRISLHAAGMASRIQRYATEGFPEHGEILLGQVSGDMDISWNVTSRPPTVVIPPIADSNYAVRVFPEVLDAMSTQSVQREPNETGGGLVGHVSYCNHCITVVDLIPPPPDSKESPTFFILGTEGLKRAIKRVESSSNGVFTYLGTWHSHPRGGGQSRTDEETLARIAFLRAYEPTICLIWTPSGIGMVQLEK